MVKLKNGKKVERKVTGQLKQYIIVTFSRKMMEYQRHIRNGQIERAKERLKAKDLEMIKKGPNDAIRFIKRKSTGKNGEKTTDSYYVDSCYTALLVYRLLETKLDQTGTHFTTDQILETLKVMNVMNFQDIFYMSAYTESKVGIALNAAFDLGLNKNPTARKTRTRS